MPLKAGDKVTQKKIKAEGWKEMGRFMHLIFFYHPIGKTTYTESKRRRSLDMYPTMTYNAKTRRIESLEKGSLFGNNIRLVAVKPA